MTATKTFITLFVAIAMFRIYPQYGKINVDDYIQNPGIFQENQNPFTTLLVPFENVESAKTKHFTESAFYQSLNGKWKFRFENTPYTFPKEFFLTSFSDKSWDEISVPSVWQMQGYDHQMYRNIPMELHPYDPPNVPKDINPSGVYRRTFEVPSGWKGRKILIHFDGIQSAGFVWINGEYAGFHEDGMIPAEFDITNLIKPGSNSLAVLVTRWCDGSYLEDQDMFRYSGIYRSVYLYSKPTAAIKDLFIKTDFDEKYNDADMILDFSLSNNTSNEFKGTINCSLYDDKGNKVSESLSDQFNYRDSLRKTVTQKITSPQKWSDEKPNLYKLVVELLNDKNEPVEIISQRVGFRELEVKNGIALLNGMPVYIRGTNRHEHNPDNGKTLTREIMLEDIKLLKQFNFNAVRTSHYPNDPLWYELCDEYGIYLQDELNAECHYTENEFPHRKEYFNAFMYRFNGMVQRDKNHPSVIMWSTGNECGLAEPHYAMADFIKKFDAGRFLMHQSNWPDGEAPYVDIIGPRYPTPSGLRQIGLSSSKPVVMGEYAHAMGNSLGHFDEFWETIYSIPKLQGGFVWDWVDQGLYIKARYIKDYSSNNILSSVMGSPESVKGINDDAIKLSGLDDWIEVYDDAKLDIRGNNIVIEATINPQKFYIENPIVTKAFQYGVVQNTIDTISFYINSYGNAVKAKLPGDWYSGWHTIKAVYDGKEMSLLIDGEVAGKKNYEGYIKTSHYPVNVGRDSDKDNDQHPGWLSNFIYDEVKIFDNAVDNKPLLWLKFDKITDGEKYFTYGISPFCHNGMITPDRKPQPELWQAKHSMSPVRFYIKDASKGIFEAVNKYSFTNLNEFETEWFLYKNSKLEKSGKIELDVLPQSKKDFTIPLLTSLDNAPEYVLEITCKLKNGDSFREKNFEVNFQQFVLNKKDINQYSLFSIKNTNKITTQENDSLFTVSSGGINYYLDKKSGRLDLYNRNKLLASSLNTNIWRAPISNEKVGWGKAEAEDWYRMGLNEPKTSLETFDISYPEDSLSALVKVKSYTNFSRSSDLLINEFEYNFAKDGSVRIKHTVTPLGSFHVDWLPCIGLSLKVPSDYQSLSWYGRGPYDNFSDRNTGSKLGIHSVLIDSVQNPFAEPQEYGNYSQVKWFEIKNGNGEGFKISVDKDINFSAVPFYNLDRAKYTYQLMKDDFSRVSISYDATGVGDTPNPPMPEYRVYPHAYSNTVLIVPVGVSTED